MPTISKSSLLYILLVILTAVSIVSLSLLYKQSIGLKSKVLPVDIESTGIKNAGISFYLTGTVIKVTPSDSGALWKVRTDDNKQYQFEVVKNATIFTEDPLKNPKASPSASINPLNTEEGSKIGAFVGINLKTNKISSGRVIILEQK